MQVRSQSNTCTLFLPQVFEIEFIFALRAVVSHIERIWDLISLIN